MLRVLTLKLDSLAGIVKNTFVLFTLLNEVAI